MKKPSLPTHPPFTLLQCKWRHSITYTYISGTFKPFLLGAWKMIKVSYYKIQILTFKFYYKHITKKKLPACTHAYIYQGPRRGRAEGDFSTPPLPNTFSDGKVISFFFTLVIQICHLPHKQGLVPVIWQYWIPTSREQTNFVS